MKDPAVLVVDLRPAALDRERRALAEGETTPSPPDEPLAPGEAVAAVAVLHDGSDDPLLLPIEPTRDRARLDAIGRILRFAVLRGERMPTVAVTYGSESGNPFGEPSSRGARRPSAVAGRAEAMPKHRRGAAGRGWRLSRPRMPAVSNGLPLYRERRLAFERALPRWAYEGVDARTLAAAPPALRRVLGRPDRA